MHYGPKFELPGARPAAPADGPRSAAQPVRMPHSPTREIWFELTEVLAGNSETPYKAEANPLWWNTVGAGEYKVNEDVTIDVVDGLKNCWGVIGDRGKARLMMADEAPVWVVVENPGLPWYFGELQEDMESGQSASVEITRAGSTSTVTVGCRWSFDGTLSQGEDVRVGYYVANRSWYLIGAGCG